MRDPRIRAVMCALVLAAGGCADDVNARVDGGPSKRADAATDASTASSGRGASGAGGAASGGRGAGGAGSGTGGASDTDGATPTAGSGGSVAGEIDGLVVELEPATPEQIGLYVLVERALDGESRIGVRYRQRGDAEWRLAHPLLRIHPEWVAGGAPEPTVDSFAGTIFDLAPGAEYDVELTLAEPGASEQTLALSAATRALPAAAPPATHTVTPADDLQAALDALAPGDVLELQDGTYDVDELFIEASGTAQAPIYVRGQSRAGVVVRDTAGRVLHLRECAHVVVENFTLEGSGVDSGTDASSVGIQFWDGAEQAFVTLRDLDIRAVDQGIIGYGSLKSVLVYRSSLRGNNLWNADFVETNLTWNDDGITLPGLGNCAFENTLHGFGDSFAVRDGTHSASVHFYRNRITMTGDDGFEADYGTRNLSFYDNFIDNASTLLSLDPLWGGPLYCFRNIAVNTVRGPFKLNNDNSGFLIYNNTIVRTEGTTDWGWVQFNNGELRNYAFRNNILIYRGPGNLLAVESGGNEPIDWSNNAWYPDGAVWWSSTGGSFDSIAAAHGALPPTTPLFGESSARHDGDVITTSDPFAAPVALGADHLTEVETDVAPALAAGSAPKGAGVEIANITDGFSGARPDMGAVIEGRAEATHGAPRP
jgi:hypothetical protein